MRRRFLKRVFDLLVAVPIFIVSLPVQAVVALLVRRRLGSPVLFRQERPGLDGHPFTMVKFRTMLDVNPEIGLVDDASRLTELGRVLRSTSLDELPTLWNVVRGDMSLVGPRPLLMQYLSLYSADQARRHLVRPGLTGLAQISGRNALSWEDKFRLDVEYVDRGSLLLDAKILMATALTVVRRDGISASGSATMPVFEGSASDGRGAA
ncbi:sugar transferase [Terrabacter sp. NPDC080008]|uniref:sugar transferase n=1 Tax=Terrabacter sp. NPDC080008 TaxID=3155176 RepID=UPI00344FA458